MRRLNLIACLVLIVAKSSILGVAVSQSWGWESGVALAMVMMGLGADLALDYWNHG
jgi:hypothetical protein